MKQLTLEWLNEKIGALYVANLQLQEEVMRLGLENTELKKEIEKPKEGEILDS